MAIRTRRHCVPFTLLLISTVSSVRSGPNTKLELFSPFCHPTFDALPPFLQVFPGAESVAAAEPEVFALLSAAVELSPEVVVFVVDLEVSEPEVVSVADVAGP